MKIKEIKEINEGKPEYKITFMDGTTALYKGILDEDNKKIPNGLRTIKYENGYIYLASFVDNNLDKIKALKYPNEDFYIGNFENKLPAGEGKMKYENGIVFKGKFENGGLKKYGILMYPNGSSDDGLFEDLMLKSGTTRIKFDQDKQEVCNSFYKDDKIINLKYFYDLNDSERYQIEVNYDIINQSLNKGLINSFEDLLKIEGTTQAIKIIDSKGNDITSGKSFNLIRDCSKQIFKKKFENIEDNVGFEGSTIELNNLFLLANLEEIESLKRIRFSSRYSKDIYEDLEQYLNSFYITTSKEYSETNESFTYISDIKDTNYFSSSMSLIKHAIGVCVDLKKIIEIMSSLKDLEIKCFYGQRD